MKFKKLLTPLIAITFVVTACNGAGTPKEVEDIKTSYYFIFGNNMDTKAEFTWRDDYFKADTNPTTNFNKDLALMSFVATANSGQKKEMKKFYNQLHFTNHYYTSVYDTGSGVDTYGFYMVSREIDDFTLVALSFRSYDYTLEWVSNVKLGESGNHEGFEFAVNNAMKEFNQVYKDKYQGKNVRLWVNGFSRGGAEANMFTTKLLNDNEFGFTMDNVYCYTFEAPACFSAENVKPEYKNIWNCANSGDIVVNIPPQDYGLYRSGTDIDILRSDFDKLYADYMHEIYPNDPDKAQEYIDMIPAFESNKKYKNETEFMNELISRILAEDDPVYGINTRAAYVEHLQPAAMFGCELFYSMDQFALYYIINDFQNRYLDTEAHMLRLAGLLMQDGGKGLYDIAKAYLDFVEYPYDDAELQKTCLIFYNIVTLIGFSDVLSIFSALPNIQRALYFHWHESNYVLIRALEYTEPAA